MLEGGTASPADEKVLKRTSVLGLSTPNGFSGLGTWCKLSRKGCSHTMHECLPFGSVFLKERSETGRAGGQSSTAGAGNPKSGPV